MIPCDEYQAGIVALFDNEAGDEVLRLAAGHLQECPDCRAFVRELIGIRRTLTAAPVPSLSPAAREAVLDAVGSGRSDRSEVHTQDTARFFRLGKPARWAAILLIGLLSIACFTLDRRAKDLQTRLGASEQQVAALHEQTRKAEAEERQQKAISALYFRMAELEERVNRAPPAKGASVPTQAYERPGRQNDL